jgi:hypothetical protein
MCSHFAGCLLSLLFDLGDRGSTFLQNVSKLLPDYTVSHPKEIHTVQHSRHLINRKYLPVEIKTVSPISGKCGTIFVKVQSSTHKISCSRKQSSSINDMSC